MDVNEERVRARVRLVATNSLWVAGFQSLFGDPCGVEIVAVSLLEAIATKEPEVVLIDSGTFKAPGALRDLLGRFRQASPHVRVIVVGSDSDSVVENESSFNADNLYIQRLIQAGAKGFLWASAHPEELTAALSCVRSGSIWAPREVLSQLVQTSQSNSPLPPDRTDHSAGFPSGGFGHERFKQTETRFTPREEQVLRLLVEGKGNREIGRTLGIGPDTVKAHLGRLMRKAGVANRIELTMYALTKTPYRTKSRAVVPIDSVCTTRNSKSQDDNQVSGHIQRWVN